MTLTHSMKVSGLEDRIVIKSHEIISLEICNQIVRNTLQKNDNGIGLLACSAIKGNIIKENIISNSTYGFYSYSSCNNSIYHNVFLNNTHSADSSGSYGTNIWN